MRSSSVPMLSALLLLSFFGLDEVASMSNLPASAPGQAATAVATTLQGHALPGAEVGAPQDGGEEEAEEEAAKDRDGGGQSEAMAVDEDDALVARERVDKAERDFEAHLNELRNSTDRRLQAMAELAKEELEREGSMGRMNKRCWERLDPLPCGRSGATALTWGGKACLIGGSDDSMVYGDVRTFEMERGEWEEEAEMEDRRMYHASALAGETLWVSGGFDGNEILASVESLGLGEPEWSRQSPLSMERMDHAMASLGDRLYVLGGSTMAEPYTRSVEVYRKDKGLWEASTPLSSGRRRFTAMVIEERVYVMGGENEDGTLDLVESWAPGECEWREEESMPTARHSHCAVEMMGRVYLMGGHDGEQVTDTVESFHPETSEWREEPPLDIPARNQAACVAQDAVFVMGGFGPGGSVPNPEKTWLRTSTHGDEYDREIEAMIDEMEGNVQNETVASQVGGVDGDDDDGVHVMDCEVDDDDGGGGTCVGMCTLRGVSVTPVPSYIYVGHAMDYFKDADKLPEQEELMEGLEKTMKMLDRGGPDLDKVLGNGWQEELAKPSNAGGNGPSGGGQAEEAGGENEGKTGLLARMSQVFNSAMDGLDLMEANASVVQRTKRRVIDSMIQEQMKAFQQMQDSNFTFDQVGESSEEEEEVSEEEFGEEGVWKKKEDGKEFAMQAGGKQERGEGGGWSLPSAIDGASQSRRSEGLGVTRRRTREGYEVEGSSDDDDEGGGGSMGRLEGSGEDDDGGTDIGSESVSSGEVNRRMELRKGSHQDIDNDDDDDDDDDDNDDGQEVVVGLDGTITNVPPGQRKQDKEEKGADINDIVNDDYDDDDDDDDDDVGEKESDASSGFERSLYEAEAFKEGVVPREVERLERRVRRAEREAEREQKLKRQGKDAGVAGHEEEEEEEEEEDIDEELRRDDPREILRSLTGSQKSENEEVMSFDERMAQPMTEMELFMEEAKRLTKEKGTDVQPADVERWCTDPELQRKYQEMVSKCGSDGGVGSTSSLTEEVSDVLPLRREDGKLTLFDDDVRRRAAETNVVLPDKFETKGDLRSFMRELLAS